MTMLFPQLIHLNELHRYVPLDVQPHHNWKYLDVRVKTYSWLSEDKLSCVYLLHARPALCCSPFRWKVKTTRRFHLLIAKQNTLNFFVLNYQRCMCILLFSVNVGASSSSSSTTEQGVVKIDKAVARIKAGLFLGWYPAEGDKELAALLPPCVFIHFNILSISLSVFDMGISVN